jgi:hypothetical protein
MQAHRNRNRVGLAVAFTLVFACSAQAGGIQIAVSVPERPFERGSKDPVLLVETLECRQAKDLRVEGTAEGVLKGKRRSVKLDIAKGKAPGLFEVRSQWPSDGVWVLVFTATAWNHSRSVIVSLAPNGGFDSVSSSTESVGFIGLKEIHQLRGKATKPQIEAVLKGSRVADGATREVDMLDWLAERLGL